MSLTLGLNTALSGLMTNQRGLDVIAQNVVNVNTKGYTRKVMTPESRVLNGKGAGVQDGGVARMINDGLLKDIRRQSSNLGRLEAEQRFYPRIDDLFGEVADNTSISHALNQLNEAFEVLATEVDKPSMQWAAVQTAQDVADQLRSMTSQLQNLRLEADREIEDAVQLVNQKITDIHDLNQKIVKNSAIATGTADLEDKRDLALTELAQFVDLQYFKRSDGGVVVYTTSGQMLLDNQPQLLTYAATGNVDAWMTAAGGQFGKITVDGGTDDLGPEIVGGELRAYLDMRDKVIPDIQASVDEMAVRMKETINQAHNRGTSLPNIANRYEGTRVFAKQPSIVPNAAETAATIYQGTTSVTSAAYTNLAIAADATTPWRATMTATAGTPFGATTYAVGELFTIAGAEDQANDGTYRVTGWTSTSQITVEKVNPAQTVQLANTDDVVIATFDTAGNQLKQTTLNAIMQTDYQVAYGGTPGTDRSVTDFDNKASRGDWSINEVSAHIESWLKSQGYTSASVNLDSDGKMVMDTGETSVSLVFRDQGSSTLGDDAADVTMAFDVNGDGAADQTVSGFANFFGLNDFYTAEAKNFIFDSAVQSASFSTSRTRDLTIYDTSGQLGETMSIPINSSLEDIAEQINRRTRSTESAALTSLNDSWTTTSAATITVSDSSGNPFTPVAIPAGPVTLEQIAGLLTQGTVTGAVVVDGANRRLRLTDSRGEELTVAITGGAISGGTDLDTTLDMTKRQRIQASVVPEGAGSRLRLVHSQGDEIYASSSLDGQGNSLITELDLKRGAARFGELLNVREDIRVAPEKVSRGSMQWNDDKDQYYISEGDNTAALGIAKSMTTKMDMDSAGAIYAGKFTLSEFAAASIAVVAREAQHSTDQLDYQSKLNESLEFQNSSFSGVNIDEEVSAMIDFQQAYSAAAKVITVLQEMLETLTNMVR